MNSPCDHSCGLRFNGGESYCIECRVYLWDMPDEDVRRLITNPECLIENRNKLKGEWRQSKFNVTANGNGDITSINEAY